MILSDIQIKESLGTYGLIEPFTPNKVKAGLSYGLNSYGYDLRLSPKSFKVPNDNWVEIYKKHNRVINPKKFDPLLLEEATLHKDETGEYFIIPPHSPAMGVALEHLTLPANVTGICIGKSTYARAGLIVYITPAEAAWYGNLTLEFYNTNDLPLQVFANEGICQILFLQGAPCEKTYEGGKYQGQTEEVTIAKAI